MSISGKATGQFQLARDETFVLCPYSACHQLTTSRMPGHLLRCRDNYLYKMRQEGRPISYAICRYNSLHKFPQAEQIFHEIRCPSRFDIIPKISNIAIRAKEKAAKEAEEAAKKAAEDPKASVLAPEEIDPDLEIEASGTRSKPAKDEKPDFFGPEDWEAEFRYKRIVSYDPAAYLEQNNIAFPRHLLTRMERRKFKELNSLRRERIQAEAEAQAKFQAEAQAAADAKAIALGHNQSKPGFSGLAEGKK